MGQLIDYYRVVARALAWIGIAAIIYLSVVPAIDRPVTGAGQWTEHFAAFALVAGTFTVGYGFAFAELLLLAFCFCAGVELLQIPLPTRHARVSDFIIDFVASGCAIGFVLASERVFGASNRPISSNWVIFRLLFKR